MWLYFACCCQLQFIDAYHRGKACGCNLHVVVSCTLLIHTIEVRPVAVFCMLLLAVITDTYHRGKACRCILHVVVTCNLLIHTIEVRPVAVICMLLSAVIY